MTRGYAFTDAELEWVRQVFAALGWDLAEYTEKPEGLHGDEPYIAAEKALAKRLDDIVIPADATPAERQPIDDEIAALRLALPQLSANDQVKPLADRVGAVEAQAQALTDTVNARLAKKAELTARLKAAKLGAELTAAQKGQYNKGRKDRVKAVADAASTEDVAAEEVTVTAFLAELTQANALAVHQKASADAIAAARAAFDADKGNIAAITAARILKALGDAQTAYRAAKTGPEYVAAGKTATDAAALIPAAKAYATHFDQWRAERLPYITFGAPPADQPALQNAYDQAVAAAEAKAATAEFPAARTELAKFDTAAKVDTGKLAEAQQYLARLDAFKAADLPYIDKHIARSKLPGTDTYKTEFEDAKKLGAAGSFLPAIAAFDALSVKVAKITPALTLFKLYRSYTMPSVQAAITTMKAKLAEASPDYIAAENAFASITAGDRAQADVMVLDKDLKSRLKAAQADLGRPLTSALAATMDQVKKDQREKSPDYPAILITLQQVEVALNALDPFAKLHGPLLARANAFPGDVAPKFLAPLHADCTTNPPGYPAAIAKVPGVQASFDKLDRYYALLADFDTYEATFTKLGETTLAGEIATAKSQAAAQLNTTPPNVDAALARLDTELAKDGLAGLITDLEIYKPVEARVAKLLASVAKLMQVKEVVDSVNDLKTTCDALAGTDRNYHEATVKLRELEALLQKVKGYAAARIQAKTLIASLKKAAARDASKSAQIYAAKSAADIDKDLAAADARAVKLELDGAKADYESLTAILRAGASVAGRVMEDQDKALMPFSGHSLDRHGPDITEDKLIERLTTGIAPDGTPSNCDASTAFDNPEDWLATRERAYELALAGVDTDPGTGRDRNPKTLTPLNTNTPPGLPLDTKYFNVGIVTDHGRPIDKAFIGMKKAVKATPDGGIGDDGCYETHRKSTGLSKTVTVFEFVFTIPDGGGEVKSAKDYVKRYKAANGDTAPTDYKGDWVVVQHFPLADGWDPDLEMYTS